MLAAWYSKWSLELPQNLICISSEVEVQSSWQFSSDSFHPGFNWMTCQSKWNSPISISSETYIDMMENFIPFDHPTISYHIFRIQYQIWFKSFCHLYYLWSVGQNKIACLNEIVVISMDIYWPWLNWIYHFTGLSSFNLFLFWC